MNSSPIRTFARVIAVAGLVSTVSVAHAEHIVMKNGDKITGTISKIWDDELFIEPAYTDEFAVDMPDIAYIESDRVFEITLADGTDVDAEFKGGDDDGNQVVVINGETRAIPIAQIEEAEEPEDYYDWESTVDLSGSIRQGNTESSNSRLNAHSILKLGDHRHIGDFVYNRETNDSVTSKQQTLLTYNYNWLFTDDWFVSGLATYERDPIRELDRRVIVGGGIGYDIWNQADRLLSVQLGLGGQSEEIGMENNENGIAYWNLRFSYDLVGGDLVLFHNHNINHNISGRDNTVIKTSTGARYEITDLLYANIEFVWDYEAEPAAGAQNEDTSLLFGLGLEF